MCSSSSKATASSDSRSSKALLLSSSADKSSARPAGSRPVASFTFSASASISAASSACLRPSLLASLHRFHRDAISSASASNSVWHTRPESRDVPTRRTSSNFGQNVSVIFNASRVSTCAHPVRSSSVRFVHVRAACSIVDVFTSVHPERSRRSKEFPHAFRSLTIAVSVTLVHPANDTERSIPNAPSSRTIEFKTRSVKKDACEDTSRSRHTAGCLTSFANRFDTVDNASSCLGDDPFVALTFDNISCSSSSRRSVSCAAGCAFSSAYSTYLRSDSSFAVGLSIVIRRSIARSLSLSSCFFFVFALFSSVHSLSRLSETMISASCTHALTVRS
mmetsp:Transcript_10750/g.38910  ORF Transcript_10750/g.38910 Transcript_10750/m.38910 type:complete len:334 (-) Transcript_10750:489-1490(-)